MRVSTLDPLDQVESGRNEVHWRLRFRCKDSFLESVSTICEKNNAQELFWIADLRILRKLCEYHLRLQQITASLQLEFVKHKDRFLNQDSPSHEFYPLI